MKVSTKNEKGCSHLIRIEVSSDELKSRLDKVYTDINKTARIAGFRPGHVPRDLIEARYKAQAQEELIKRAIGEYYIKAIEEQKLSPVAPPDIANVQFKNNTLHFDAKVDIAPEVKLKAYRNLKITKLKEKVDQTQVDEVLKNLRKSRVQKTNPEQKEKEAVLPPLDDKFAQDLGLKSVDELKDAVRKNLEATAQMKIKADMERQLVAALLKIASFEVPQSLVANQTQETLRQLKINQIMQGVKQEEVDSKEKQLQEQAKKEAERRVRVSFILQTIAKEENIQPTEEDIPRRIEEIAQSSGQSADQVVQYLQKENLFPSLEAELKSKKTIEFLLSQAKIVEK